jgi:excisionase family DNA binding protein
MGEPLVAGATEAARLLGCSKAHIYNLIERGELPTVPHMGGRKVIPMQAIEDLVAAAARPQHVRCTPCWMTAHISCEGGACTCTDEFHKGDGAGLQPDAIENRAGSAAQEAG